MIENIEAWEAKGREKGFEMKNIDNIEFTGRVIGIYIVCELIKWWIFKRI